MISVNAEIIRVTVPNQWTIGPNFSYKSYAYTAYSVLSCSIYESHFAVSVTASLFYGLLQA